MRRSVELEKIEIENFLSFKDKQEFAFSHNGIHRIIGENYDKSNNNSDNDEDVIKANNGSGKSNLMNAVSYALFGEGIIPRKKVEKYIHKNTKNGLRVAIYFNEVTEGSFYIERYRKDQKFKNGLFLYKKNKDNVYENITLSETTLTQEKIEDIIGIKYENFKKTIAMSRESDLKKNFIEMSPSEKGELIENIIRLNELLDKYKLIKTKMSAIRKELKENMDEKLKFSSSIVAVKNNLSQSIASFKKDKIKILQDIDNLKQNIESQNKYDSNDLLKYYKLYDEKELVKKEATEVINQYKLKENSISGVKNNATILYKKYKNAKVKIVRLNRELTEELNMEGKVCPNCNFELESDEHLKIHLRIKEEIKETIKLVDDYKQSFKKEKIVYKKQLAEFALIQETKKYLRDKLLNNFTELTKEIESFIVNNKDFANKITETNNKIVELKQTIDTRKDFILKESKRLRKETIKQYKNSLNEVNKKIDILNVQKQIGEFWEKAYDTKQEANIKEFAIGKIIPVLNNVINTILNIVFEGKLQITFDNSFNETIVFNNHQYDYYEFSSGEKASINLSLSFALANLEKINSTKFNVLFLDEVFSFVDEYTIRGFIDFIRNNYAHNTGVYIVSHEKGMDEYLNAQSIIKIIKRKENSVIEIAA